MPKDSNKSYLAKDFTSLRADLLSYAQTYFSEQIRDFSEASMGGLLLDMAAYVGDTMSFYLDYQFKELNPQTAIESQNVVNHAKNAGVDIVGASPAVVDVTFTIQVPSKQKADGSYEPNPSYLPVIKALNTVLVASNGVSFTLESDLDFGEKNDDGILLAAYRTFSQLSSGAPGQYICSRAALCMSGKTVVENFSIANINKPFRKITLTNTDVSEIISVRDSQNNTYYEVESLTQNVVYRRVKNIDENKDIVDSNFEILPAPYRFIKETDFNTRLTTIQFGSGDADSLDDDILPDPSQLALPLYGKKVFSRFSIDPNSLMKTKTLGISPKNTTIEVLYRYGGGLQHNVSANTITNMATVNVVYPSEAADDQAGGTVNSMAVNNFKSASGGAPALTLDDLKTQISSARNQQSRIVTQQDLLARIYTMPNNYGRVVRAGLRKDERNPLATQLFVISQDASGKMRTSPDALKKNLRKYLNEFRLISDAIDILDAIIINYGVEFTLICHPHTNKSLVVANVLARLQNISQIKFFQIDQPLVEADIINTIISTDGVLSLVSLKVVNYSGVREGRYYSDYALDMSKNKFKGLYVGPPGSIFELRHPSTDLIGNAE
jgi:hypothetical protein